MTRRRWLTGMLSGVGLGVFIGVSAGVERHSLRTGVLAGVLAVGIFAILMPILAALVLRRPGLGLRGLSGPDRETVIRTINKGHALTDARLAPAVITHAEFLRRNNAAAWLTSWPARLMFGVVIILNGSEAVADAVGGDAVGSLWNSVLAIAWIAGLLILPRLQERNLHRIVDAEQSARALLGKSGSAGDHQDGA